MSAAVVLIAGTGAWANDSRVDWYCPTSPFVSYIAAHGIFPIFGKGIDQPCPFVWSTRLGGVGFGNHDLLEWAAAGANLFMYCVPPLCPDRRLLPSETNIIAHSHGLQVVLYACARGLKVNALVSVGSPIRKDMEATAKAARPNIGRWLHLHSDCSDRWQWLGELFDGHLGIVREHPLADLNDCVPNAGHSSVLERPEYFHLWEERGWLTWLRAIG